MQTHNTSLQIGASISCLFIDGRTWDMLLFFSPVFIKMYSQYIVFAGSTVLLESSEVCFRHPCLQKLRPNYLLLISIHFKLFFTYNSHSKFDCQYCCFFLVSKKCNETINTSPLTAIWEMRAVPKRSARCGNAEICEHIAWLLQSSL